VGADTNEAAVLVDPLFVELIVAGKRADRGAISCRIVLNIGASRGWEGRVSDILVGILRDRERGSLLSADKEHAERQYASQCREDFTQGEFLSVGEDPRHALA